MTNPTDRAKHFLELHRKGEPLLLANVWDPGSARLVASLGYEALATTSSGHAGTLGRRDGEVSRGELLDHTRALADATRLPVSADLENGLGDSPEAVAGLVREAMATGLAGGSIEDFGNDPDVGIYDAGLARERVQAAAEVAGDRFVLTARAENHIRGNPDLADTIARLQSFQEAGAAVAYAPGLASLDEVRQVVAAVDLPVNVLCRPKGPTVAELASVGVARISVGGAFFYAALGALATAAKELREQGTSEFWQGAGVGITAATAAFSAEDS